MIYVWNSVIAAELYSDWKIFENAMPTNETLSP